MAVDIDDMFRRAAAAVEGGNYDYAEELFREILRADPNHVKARMALRGCCRKRFDEQGSSAKFMGAVKGITPYLRAQLNSGKPNKCIEACEDYLRNNPYNVQILTKEGVAARKAGHHELAIFIFEDIRHRNPGRIPAIRQLGEIYEDDLDDVHKAINYYTEIAHLNPADGHILKKLKDLNARMHMVDTQIEKQESFFDGVKVKELQKQLQEKDREGTVVRNDEQVDGEIRKMQALLHTDPKSIPHLKRLADLFNQKKQPGKAIAAYKKVLDIQPDEYEAKSRVGDITLASGGQNLHALEEKLAASPEDEGLKAKVEAGKRQLAEFRAKEYDWRTKAHPTDLQIKKTYGDALMACDRVDDAIGQYQAALEDIRIRVPVRIALGRCFMEKGQFDLAISQFEQTLGTYSFMTQDAKETHYSLGVCAENLGDVEKALQHYKTIYEVDIKFRDVSTKIDDLNKR